MAHRDEDEGDEGSSERAMPDGAALGSEPSAPDASGSATAGTADPMSSAEAEAIELAHQERVVEIESEESASGGALSAGEASLRSSAIKGGAYLAAREVAGIVLRAGGIVVVTRLIGPGSYGVYAAAAAFAALIATISQMGLEVYLIRQPEEPSETLYRQVFSFLLVVSVSAAGLAALISLALADLVSGIGDSQRVFLVLMVSVPLNVLWAPAQAKIERAFGYKRMAWLELGGDVAFYAVAVVLAFAGTGAWSLAIGFVAWQGFLLVGSYRLAGMRPGWSWSNATVRDLLRHGTPYASTNAITAGKGLINPIVVGRLYGSTGVGYVALALRLIDTLGFAQRATWRLGLVALSKVRGETDRLVRGVEQGMVLQLLATAGPILGACVLANWAIPLAFGNEWIPMIPVFAWLAVGRITTAPLTVEFAVLYAASRNTEVAVGTLVNLIATFVLALVLVPVLGVVGYGVATVIGIVAWVHVHHSAHRIAPFKIWPTARLSIGLVPLALFPLVSWPVSLVLFVPLIVITAVPQVHRELLGYVHLVWGGLRRPGEVSR